MGETFAGRRHLPRNPPPSRDTPFTPRASSELSAPKRSPSTKSSSSESNKAKPATKYLSSLLNDTTAPANLCLDFLKGFGIADHSGVGDELRDLSHADGAASHAAPSGLTSEGRSESERDTSTPTVKSADLAASRARAPAALGLDASRPSDIALAAGWGAANTSVVRGGTSSAGNCISCDAGASSSGGAACSCDGSGSAF